jgi:putative ABC transport system permease protein
MRLALREMRRRPGRFVTATVILTLIAVLLMFLGGLLDGLINSSTGAIKAQPGDVIVVSATSEVSFPTSRLTGDDRTVIEAVPGVADVGGLGVAQFGARVPDRGPRDLVDAALFGYELAPRGLPAPPTTGQVLADASLREQGIAEGDQLELGPSRAPVTVVGFVPELPYNGQGTLWGSLDTWRDVQSTNRPDAVLPADVVQAFVVDGNGSVPPIALASAIDAATGGTTETLGVQAAADAQPGVEEQRSTFNQILGVTVAIAVVVVALFFALLIVERTALYGVLKAIGARTRTLFGGVVVQAVVVTLIAGAIGALAALALDAAISAGGIPFALTGSRIVSSVVYLLVAAVIGCTFSLRRVVRIDPASAIGSGS